MTVTETVIVIEIVTVTVITIMIMIMTGYDRDYCRSVSGSLCLYCSTSIAL